MDQQFPIGLQVALYAASGAIVVLAAVLVRAALRVQRQLERVVTAVEAVEAELTPLARETRVNSDLLMSPLRTFNLTTRLVRMGVVTFLTTLWTGRPRPDEKARAS